MPSSRSAVWTAGRENGRTRFMLTRVTTTRGAVRRYGNKAFKTELRGEGSKTGNDSDVIGGWSNESTPGLRGSASCASASSASLTPIWRYSNWLVLLSACVLLNGIVSRSQDLYSMRKAAEHCCIHIRGTGLLPKLFELGCISFSLRFLIFYVSRAIDAPVNRISG